MNNKTVPKSRTYHIDRNQKKSMEEAHVRISTTAESFYAWLDVGRLDLIKVAHSFEVVTKAIEK